MVNLFFLNMCNIDITVQYPCLPILLFLFFLDLFLLIDFQLFMCYIFLCLFIFGDFWQDARHPDFTLLGSQCFVFIYTFMSFVLGWNYFTWGSENRLKRKRRRSHKVTGKPGIWKVCWAKWRNYFKEKSSIICSRYSN